MASGTFATNSGTYLNLRVFWESTPNIEGNFSTVTTRVVIESKNLYSSARPATINLAGSVLNYTAPAINRSSSTVVQTHIGSHTVNVAHDSDGSGSAYIGASWSFNGTYNGVSIGTLTAANTVTLDNIPRTSQITGFSNFDIGAGVDFNIASHSSSFTHKADLVHVPSGITIRIAEECRGGTQHFNLAEAEKNSFYNAMSNTAADVFKLFVSTYINGSIVGTVADTAIGTIPSSIVPVISSVTATRVDGTVPAAWGIYVQNKSKCTLKINGASGNKGAGISSYRIEGSGFVGTQSQYTTGFLNQSGNITFTATVTDTRGRTASKQCTIKVEPYSPPVISNIDIKRCLASGTENDEGTYISAKAAFSCSPVAAKNSVAAKVKYKKATDASWGTPVAITSGLAKVIGGAVDIDYSYNVMLEATDAFGTVSQVFDIMPSFSLLELKKGGKGIAFGKAAELDGVADFGLPIRAREGIYIDNKTLIDFLYPVGCVYQSTNPTSPQILFDAGKWELIEGRTLMGVDASDSDFSNAGKTGGEKNHLLKSNEVPAAESTQVEKLGVYGAWVANTSHKSTAAEGHNNLPPYYCVYIWHRIA